MKNKLIRNMIGITALYAAIYGGTIAVPAEQVPALSPEITQNEAPASAGSGESSNTAGSDNTADSAAALDSSSSDAAAAGSRKQVRGSVISYRFSPAVAAGTEITVSDAKGTIVFSATAQSPLSMICFSSENLEEGEYTIKAGTQEDTITVQADQFPEGKGHGKMGGRNRMQHMNDQQAPGSGSRNIPQAPGSNGSGSTSQAPGSDGSGSTSQAPGSDGSGSTSQAPDSNGSGSTSQTPGSDESSSQPVFQM